MFSLPNIRFTIATVNFHKFRDELNKALFGNYIFFFEILLCTKVKTSVRLLALALLDCLLVLLLSMLLGVSPSFFTGGVCPPSA